MRDLAVLDMAAGLEDLEPADLAQGARRPADGVLDRLLDALLRGAGDFDDPVHMVWHLLPPVAGAPRLILKITPARPLRPARCPNLKPAAAAVSALSLRVGFDALIAGRTEMPVTMYHNPRCNTSRRTLALLRESGVEPRSSNI